MAAYPCSDDPQEVIESILEAQDNAELFDKFVNGGVLEEVQLGVGEPTPTLRNLSHLVKSAAATLDGSDVSGKFSDAANGGETLRMLSDRFGDVFNIKDFGAIGDGIADDTDAADAWLAAEGGMKYIPAGDYLVRGTVHHYPQGRWWDGKTTDIEDLYIAPALTLFGGQDVGTDYPGIVSGDSNAWDGATQGPFVDPFDKVLYIVRQNSSGQTRISALRWSEKPEERVALGHSPFGWNLGHQNNALYRPSALSEPLFFFPRNYYVSEGVTAVPYSVRVTKWDYRNPETFTVVRELTLFDSSVYTTDNILHFGITFDSKYFFAEAVRNSDSKRIVRFWDVEEILNQNNNNIAGLYKFESIRPEGTATGGQAVVSDGKHLWQLSGSSVTYMSCTTLSGELCFHRPKNIFKSKRYGDLKVQAEAEGLFWAPWNGHLEMFYMTSDMVYDKGNDTDYTRRDTFWLMSSPSQEQPEGIHAAYKAPPVNSNSVADLNLATEPGWYYTAADNANMPSGNPGYLLVVRHIFDTWNGVQIHVGRGSVKNMYLRYFTSNKTFGEWEKVTFQTDSNVARHGSFGIKDTNLVKGTRPTNEADRELITFYDSEGTGTQNRLATIRNRIGTSSENNDRIEFQIYEFTHESSNYASVSLVLGGTEMAFRPTSTGGTYTYVLGTTNRRWDNIYAVTSNIGESDRRLKDAVDAPSEALMRAWSKVRTVAFQFKDAIEKKGADARIHIGCIAQEIDEAFASEGLDASRYGLFCYDEWEDEYEDVEVLDQQEVLDGQGNTVTPERSHVEHRLVTPAGNVYSLRYEECLCLEMAYQRWLGGKRDAEIEALKTRLQTLEGNSEADS